MNFLEGVQRLRMECGVEGLTGPVSVTDQTGEMLELVTWYNSAYEDILNLHKNWRFMQEEFSFNTIASVSTYTAAGVNITDLGEWITDDTRVYLLQADEQRIEYMPWAQFKESTQIGTIQTGRPSLYSVKPDNSLVFWPTPDTEYTVVGEYYKKPEQMDIADASEPVFPSQYHMIIVWRALIYYGAGLAALEKHAFGQAEYTRLRRSLEFSQLPRITWGAPLA